MATTQSQPEYPLQINRTFAAPRDRVYRAWTDARQFALWFHPSTDYKTVITRLDLRVGGKYSVEMHHKGGNIHRMWGMYEEVRPPEKIVFTWRWSEDESLADTLVTVRFTDLGGSTEVSLTHERFHSVADRDKHNEGWIACLGQLGAYLA
ncbi:MAG TPA: SRPBCC domain-containing protein [Candidatus Acidoferrum sp.]|nr:SRPBCC domain-containing protein [Candidatus Acidoferrum sp.]